MTEDVRLEVHPSAPSHYRQRVGFGVFDIACAHEHRAHLRDTSEQGHATELRYVYWENGFVVPLPGDVFPIASRSICALMPKLLLHLAADSNVALRRDVRAAKFLSTMSNGEHHMLLTLVYKQRALGAEWQAQAERMRAACSSEEPESA